MLDYGDQQSKPLPVSIQKFNAYFNAVSSKERVAAEKRAAIQSIAGNFRYADELLRSLDV
ncbi:MAG: hypothetical protein IPG99_19385 [Ignavibacteria bacterium]|nr:hypothetical protein [Ignavibacteria bacterium]